MTDNDVFSSTTNTSDCIQVFSSHVFQAVAVVRAVSGLLSVIASLLVIILIIVYKKYLFFTQRLILYLSTASMLNGLTIATQGASYFPDNKHSDIYCSLSAFFEQTTHWSLLLAIASITVSAYLMVVHGYESGKGIVHFIIIFIIPIFFNWLPFVNGVYGMSGPWCWITTKCNTNTIGKVYQYILWYIPLYTVLIGIIVIYVIVYIFIRKQEKQYKGNFDPDRIKKMKQEKKEVISLMYYPLIFLLLQIPATINRITDLASGDQHILPLWFLHAFFSPLQGGLVCLVYALDPETRSKLRKTSLKSIIYYLKYEDVSEYPTLRARSDSISDDTVYFSCK